jgi:hypothetical protein
MFTFVDLSSDEIVQGLNAAGIDVKKISLESPKAIVITPIYKQYLMVLANFDDEAQLEHPQLAPGIEAPEELKSGFVFLNFFRQLLLLMKSAAVPDFSLSDLIKPERDRVQHNLSGLINFGIFREDRLVMFQRLQEHLNQRVRENQEMEDQLRKLTEKQDECLRHRLEIDTLESQKRSRITELNEVDEAIAAVQDSLENRKRDELRIRAEIEKVNRDLEFTGQTIGELKAEEKLSRDEILADLARVKTDFERQCKQSESAQSKLVQLKEREKFLGGVRMRLLEALDTVHPIMQDMN